ncbi:NUDIX hydrolase [Altericista sp. CCNU0014]|uniref:NUDIX hydrolase n=1 Tax=Altericista sp. CCNU0014 TaxID=3082949 RepID=UPI0038513F72
MAESVKHVAIAILTQCDRFLMQLRDPVPHIVHPGHWGMFGGHLDAGETPQEAIWRELAEEICYTPPALTLFCEDREVSVVRHVFYGELAVPIEALDLREGWDLGLLTAEQIQAGWAHSAIAQRACPIGAPHQRLLLEFLQHQANAVAIEP